MELFYSCDIIGDKLVLHDDEATHCIKVLRHKRGDKITVIDGQSSLYTCIIKDIDTKQVNCQISEHIPSWNTLAYNLTMAVAPTKNIDRYEYFVEKATEIGVTKIVPILTEHSERRIIKSDRLNKLSLAAAKQSLKGRVPQVNALCRLEDFIDTDRLSTIEDNKTAHNEEKHSAINKEVLRLIAYCGDEFSNKISITEALENFTGKDIIILIGPEGDFTPQEVKKTLEADYKIIHLGNSRLRTETAALMGVSACYLNYLK